MRQFTKYPSGYINANADKSDMKNLIFIRKQARQAALRDGYDQVIIENFEADPNGNRYSFSRKFPGCCPEWQGSIIEEVNLVWEHGNPVVLINEV